MAIASGVAFKQKTKPDASITSRLLSSTNIPPPVAFGVRLDSEAHSYYLFLAALALTYWVIRQTVRSPIGRAMVSIREDALVAQSLGINTPH